ncbi:MAG: prepilin-type N-terminal cleavage/methylation domain-containing protein [Rubrivivax sp.]|nr:prepilin-type N-terminal cleavage/methylation domain-containing protein [Rubrivivax sp.]
MTRAAHRLRRQRQAGRDAGFTLVEVLVALLMMALLAGLSWQALDGVLRARDDSRVAIDRTVRLSTVLTQWEQDLQALHDTSAVPALSFDGQTLRLTRRSEDGVMLVAWAVRGGQWQRWTAPAYVRVGELQEAWLRSQQLQGTEPGTVQLTAGASQWQIYFARGGGQWSNAQSTGDLALPIVAAPPPPPASGASAPGGSPPPQRGSAREALPEAVRLLITLDGQTLTRDIALGPAGS